MHSRQADEQDYVDRIIETKQSSDTSLSVRRSSLSLTSTVRIEATTSYDEAFNYRSAIGGFLKEVVVLDEPVFPLPLRSLLRGTNDGNVFVAFVVDALKCPKLWKNVHLKKKIDAKVRTY